MAVTDKRLICRFSLVFLLWGFFLFPLTAKNNPVFELITYSLNGEYNNSVLQMKEGQKPVKLPELLLYFNRHYFDEETHSFKCYLDLYFPEETAIYECSGFYIPELEDSILLDEVFIQWEENRIASEIEKLEEESIVFNEENAALNEEISNVISGNIQEQTLLTGNNTLSYVNYDDEIFMPKKLGKDLVTVSISKNETIRTVYDSKYRVIKKEYWDIKGLKDSSILKKEEYIYKNDSFKFSQKIIQAKNYKEVITYNASGKVLLDRKYDVKEDKSYLVQRHQYKYDKENQVLEDIKISYTYSEDYLKVIDSFEQKHVFTYNGWEDIPADEEYYEDGVLKLATKYTKNAGNYSTVIYFDKEYAVKTYYEKNEKVREVFTMNGEVWRLKDYGKN